MRITEIKPVRGIDPASEYAILASYFPGGEPYPGINLYLSALKAQGFKVIVMAALDNPCNFDLSELDMDQAEGVLIRQNSGYDHYSWRLTLESFPDLYRTRACLLTNDSMFGPNRSFERLVKGMRATGAPVIALTNSYEHVPHIQSYFLYFKAEALQNRYLRSYIGSFDPRFERDQVIYAYELPLANYVQNACKLPIAIAFQVPPHYRINPAFHGWTELLRAGFPFIKRDCLCANFKKNPEHLFAVAREHGFDLDVLRRLIDRLCLAGTAKLP
ncbi:MAG: rhamnan synthesis F family protein [Nevskia sp.]|nr:rhamnan synthesis F family protein [Nevskia sp.]